MRRAGMPFPRPPTPLEFLFVQEYDDGPTAQARQAGAAVITHPDIRWGRCDIKSTNLLANVLANQAAAEAGCCEALLYLPDGTMSEASHSSFFTVKGGVLHTTPLKANILPGITRNFLIRLAQKADIPVREQTISPRGPTQGGRDVPDRHHDGGPLGGHGGRQAHRRRQARPAWRKRLLDLHQKAVREFLSSPMNFETSGRFFLT